MERSTGREHCMETYLICYGFQVTMPIAEAFCCQAYSFAGGCAWQTHHIFLWRDTKSWRLVEVTIHMLSNTEIKYVLCVWTNLFLQQEYVIIRRTKCKNKHRDEIGVQFEVYIQKTTFNFLFVKEEHVAYRWTYFWLSKINI